MCMCVCMCVYVSMYVCMYGYACMCVCVCVFVYGCLCARLCVCVNLKFVGKLIERAVSVPLQNHMKIHNLNSDLQYGYKIGHSTEKPLLRVVIDLLLNTNKPSILMLLDLSAAFDIADQPKLLKNIIQ